MSSEHCLAVFELQLSFIIGYFTIRTKLDTYFKFIANPIMWPEARTFVSLQDCVIYYLLVCLLAKWQPPRHPLLSEVNNCTDTYAIKAINHK